jgi:hypothetical protein
MVASSYITHTSVRSDSGAPYFGTTWMNPPNGCSRWYTSSSSLPSTRSGASSLIARIVA